MSDFTSFFVSVLMIAAGIVLFFLCVGLAVAIGALLGFLHASGLL